jgi:hypothetical protein
MFFWDFWHAHTNTKLESNECYSIKDTPRTAQMTAKHKENVVKHCKKKSMQRKLFKTTESELKQLSFWFYRHNKNIVFNPGYAHANVVPPLASRVKTSKS